MASREDLGGFCWATATEQAATDEVPVFSVFWGTSSQVFLDFGSFEGPRNLIPGGTQPQHQLTQTKCLVFLVFGALRLRFSLFFFSGSFGGRPTLEVRYIC